MSRSLPNHALLLFALFAPWATGCHGSSSGSGKDNNPTTGLVFADEFDGARLAPHWVPSDPTAIDVRDGALTIRDNGRRNTAFLDFWSFAAANIRFVIRTAPPSDATCQFGLPILTPMFALLDAATGEYIAGVMFLPCANGAPIRFRYWVGDPNIQFFEEQMPNGTVDGSFFDFALRIDAEGATTWSRNGVDQFDASLGGYDRLRILLSSGQGAPALPMRFDSVVVRRN